MNGLQMREEVGREISLIPEEQLTALYSVVHAFRLAVTTSVNRDKGIDHASQAFPVHPQRAVMQRQVDKFEEMRPHLWQKFPLQYVALYNETVVDHDVDELALLQRIDKQYPDEIVLVRQVTESPLPDLVFRSPRFID